MGVIAASNETSQLGGTINNKDVTQLVVFRMGKQDFALNIDQIKEVVLTPGIAALPKAPDYVKGVANVRGDIIVIMDLEQRFGVSGIKSNDGKYTLVLASDQFRVGFLVDKVPNTLNVALSSIDKKTTALQYSHISQSSIAGIVKNENRIITVIDFFELMKGEKLQNLI